MSGNPDKASLWADADVYIDKTLQAANPASASDPFPAAWDLTGLLDGGDGFEYSRDEDTSDFFAWGGILVATSRKNFKQTVKFSALEDNDTTRDLLWPGSTSSALFIPKPAKVKVGLETRTGGKIKRMITKNYAEITLDGSYKDGEDELTKYPFLMTVFPDGNGQLWVPLSAPVLSSLAVDPTTLAVGVDKIGKVSATGTYSDSTSGDVSSQVTWTSSDSSIATVDKGYVTGVAAGTANVVASVGVVSATCVVTVS